LLLGELGILFCFSPLESGNAPGLNVVHEFHCRDALVEEVHHVEEDINLRAAEFLYVGVMDAKRVRRGCLLGERSVYPLLHGDRKPDFRLKHVLVIVEWPALMLLAGEPLAVLAAHIFKQQRCKMIPIAAMIPYFPALLELENADELSVAAFVPLPLRIVPH
jgi:hypothetical protein